MSNRLVTRSPSHPATPIRWIIYLLAITHFLILIIAYSGNSQKSTNKDKLITYLKPYLIGLNWDVELVPVEWNAVLPGEGCARLLLKTDTGETFYALSSNSTQTDRQRERQLIGMINMMALNANDDGLSSLLVSAIKYAEETQNKTFSSVVIEQREYGTSEYLPVYEARKVVVDNTFALLPKIEGQRTVRSLVTAAAAGSSSKAEGIQ
ncbi:MAG: hypothetical protein ACK5PB_05480 [Pirellula sp.]